jgi:hypothetical protein
VTHPTSTREATAAGGVGCTSSSCTTALAPPADAPPHSSLCSTTYPVRSSPSAVDVARGPRVS